MAKRTNILFFLTVFGTGGTARLVADIAPRLDPDRFRVFACSLLGGPIGDRLAATGCPVYTITHAVNGHRPRLIGKLQALRARVAQVEALIERHEIDILHTHHLAPLLHAFLIRRPARRWRWVHTEHIRPDVDVEYARWLERVGRWLLLSRPDIVTGASHAVGAYMRDRVGMAADRVRVVLNGVDVDRFGRPHDGVAKRREIGIPADAWVIGNVANLRPQKNHEALLRAFAQLLPDVPNAWLVLVGDWELRPELRALADALGIGERVRFLGVRLDVPELYAVFDVYCLPSHYEGLPLSVLEAMSARKPVVGTRVVGIQEVVTDGETGLLVEPDDPTALARALLRLRQDPALAERLASGAVRYVHARGRLEGMVQRYVDVYTDVLARERG